MQRKKNMMLGGDITKLDYDIETVTDDAGKETQRAFIRIGDEVVGQLETTAPEGMMSEFQAYTAITGAPILFGEGSKWKFYKTKGEEKPAAAQPAAAGGLPAVQAQAPAAPATAAMPTAPDNPFAAPAEKETTARAETTEKKTKEARKTEIKRLTEQMQRLAPPQTVSLMALETGGAQGMPGVMQDPAQQAKLKQQYDELYYRRDKLVAVDEGRVFATKEEAKASKKKFTSGTIIYVGGIPAKVK